MAHIYGFSPEFLIAIGDYSMSQEARRSTLGLPTASARMMEPRRSSLFDLPELRHIPCGSSITAFACEPKIDEEFAHGRQKKIQYENTYRMEPPGRFKAETVNAIIKEVLEKHLTGKTYEPIACSLLSKSLAQEIKTKVKDLNFKRYKIVSVVTIGEKKDQDVRVGSRCVWDVDRDSFSSASYDNPHLYALGNVYALYFE